jgi:hypothetical protein
MSSRAEKCDSNSGVQASCALGMILDGVSAENECSTFGCAGAADWGMCVAGHQPRLLEWTGLGLRRALKRVLGRSHLKPIFGIIVDGGIFARSHRIFFPYKFASPSVPSPGPRVQ